MPPKPLDVWLVDFVATITSRHAIICWIDGLRTRAIARRLTK